ncbi:hypothetical protein MJT46_012121 [Ovis ammon polii x Ovis aries]|nr:hypothetical protein MJT46_012121 [Ovis ammon polii x Ovis aries]
MQEKNVELLDLNNNQSHHKLYYTAKCQAPECSSLSHKKTARKRRLVHLELTANQLSVAQIYAGLNGEWVAKHVTGQKTENNTYVVEYEGENKFEVIYASDTVLVVSVVNKDKNKKCGEIQLAGIFVKVNDIEEKALEIFKELLKLKGIEEKYIVNFFKGGLNCQLQNAISNSSKRATGWEYNQNLMKKEKPKSEANDFPAERSYCLN